MFEIKNIYEKYKQDVFYYLLSLTQDPTLSEDLVSETFLNAIKSLSKFKGDSDIKTWLFSIARYRWYGYLRKKKDDISFDELAENYLKDEVDVQEITIKKEVTKKILSILDRETERAKQIVLMRIKGYSFYEISKKYDISESSARVIDFRTKKKIRQLLEKEGFKDE
ncbi:MAG: RNA polymerase sigma factor [Peptoniphilaceae bacterium]